MSKSKKPSVKFVNDNGSYSFNLEGMTRKQAETFAIILGKSNDGGQWFQEVFNQICDPETGEYVVRTKL